MRGPTPTTPPTVASTSIAASSGTSTTAGGSPAEASATTVCNGYTAFKGHFPTYLHNQDLAVNTVQNWASYAQSASNADPAYRSLFRDVTTFVGDVASPQWPQKGTPADPEFTAVGHDCQTLSTHGLVH